MIRQAKISDIPYLLPLIERLHDKTIYSDIPFDEDSVTKSLLFGIQSPAATVFIDNEFQGVIGVSVVGHPVNNNWLTAKEVVFTGERLWVGTQLVNAAVKWAQDMGCKELRLGLEPTVCPKGLSSLYKRWGFTPTFAAFTRRL